MIDADVQRAIKSVLDSAVAAGPFLAVVAQSYQPTQQGVPLDATILFTKISARRWGFQGRKAVYNPGNDNFDLTESWYLWATYQVNVVMNQNPVDPTSLSAYDILDFCAGTLQSAAAGATFRAAGIGRGRITDIRTPGSRDDSDRFAKNVNFDFDLTYQNTLETTVPEAGIAGQETRV